MPQLRTDGPDIVIHLSALEKLGAFSGDIRVPLASVVDAVVEPDPWSSLRGIRAPGTGIPGVIACGTRVYRGGRDFALVRGRRPALRIDLAPPSRYARLLVTVDDPAAALAALSSHTAGTAN